MEKFISSLTVFLNRIKLKIPLDSLSTDLININANYGKLINQNIDEYEKDYILKHFIKFEDIHKNNILIIQYMLEIVINKYKLYHSILNCGQEYWFILFSLEKKISKEKRLYKKDF